MYRRDFLKSLPVLAAPATVAMASRSGQPEPIETQIGQLDGVTCLVRFWAPGDTRLCRLCRECTADHSVCILMTNDRIDEDDAPLYDARGLDFGHGLA